MQNNSAIIARGLYTLVTEGPIFFWEVLGFDIGEVITSIRVQLSPKSCPILVSGGMEEQHALPWEISRRPAVWSNIRSGLFGNS